jgi:hypothetical protein
MCPRLIWRHGRLGKCFESRLRVEQGCAKTLQNEPRIDIRFEFNLWSASPSDQRVPVQMVTDFVRQDGQSRPIVACLLAHFGHEVWAVKH